MALRAKHSHISIPPIPTRKQILFFEMGDNKLKEVSIMSFSPECDPRLVIKSFMDGRDYYFIHDDIQRFGKDSNSFCFNPKEDPWDHYDDFDREFCQYLRDTVIVVCFKTFSTYNTDNWHTFLGFLRGNCWRDRRGDWTIYTIECLPKPDLPCVFYIDEEEYQWNLRLTFELLAQSVQTQLNPKWKEWIIKK